MSEPVSNPQQPDRQPFVNPYTLLGKVVSMLSIGALAYTVASQQATTRGKIAVGGGIVASLGMLTGIVDGLTEGSWQARLTAEQTRLNQAEKSR